MDAIQLTDQVRVAEGVLIREVSGEAVLLNLKNEQYYGLDAIGLRMWQTLTNQASIQQGIDDLLAEYEIDRITLEKDVLDLLGELAGQGLVEIINAR